MFKSKKITVVAGVLGSTALMGLGAVHAVAVESPAKCTNDGKGLVRCEDVREEHITSDKYGKIRLVNDQRQSCSGGGAKVSCTTSTDLGDERS